MARVVGFKNALRAACSSCGAIIEYRENELKEDDNKPLGLYCPNCRAWVIARPPLPPEYEFFSHPHVYEYNITCQANEEKVRTYSDGTVVPQKPKFYPTQSDLLNNFLENS